MSTRQADAIDTATLRELLTNISPEPWEYYRAEECQIKPHVVQRKRNGGSYTIATPVHSNGLTERNMQFISAARSALPACLDEIDRLRKDAARYYEATTIAVRTLARNSSPEQKAWSLKKIRELRGDAAMEAERVKEL
jgi:hypothetical protein